MERVLCVKDKFEMKQLQVDLNKIENIRGNKEHRFR